MKQQSGLSRMSRGGAYLVISIVAMAQNPQLPLKHGTYVDESVSCKEPPFAVTQSWDGTGFSGPHSSSCKSHILSQRGNQFHIATSCAAIGDGTSNPSGQVDTETLILTRLSNTRFERFSESKPKATYRWCSATNETRGVAKEKP
jgi:hypothetical protein